MELLQELQRRAIKMNRRLKELGLFRLDKTRLQGVFAAAFHYLKGANRTAGEEHFIREGNDMMS